MSNQLTKSDFELLWKNYNSALVELQGFEDNAYTTKKDIVIRIRDTVDLLVANEQIPIKKTEISSYCWNLLSKKGITFYEKRWAELFDDDQKRNYITNPQVGDIKHKCEFDKLHSVCSCGNLEKNGVVYIPKPIVNDADVTTKSKNENVKSEDMTPAQECLFYMKASLKAMDSVISKVMKKYATDERYSKTLDEDINMRNSHGMKHVIDQEKGRLAEIQCLENTLDERYTITEIVRLKAILLEDITYSTSKVAKLIGITPKHLKNNIISKSNPQSGKANAHHDHLKWFKSIDFTCRECCRLNVIDIDKWFTRQIKRKKLDLDFERV